MMAPEPNPPPAALSPETLDELRRALALYLREENHSLELQDLLRRMNEEAREKGMTAEQVLVALKKVWYSLAEVRSADENEPQRALLQRVVTRCIQQYYAR